ncbi:MAG: 2-hydroxychromene-2-carboxylate isomerase [Alphaproteobacteria bacterium]|nr:MAG: 2-hydroxychromene-2-carboxylate isomerase [Alphaproteobacteria bacterium]
MAAPLDFYFDFSSPYGYFASKRIDEIGRRHGREVTWRPFLLGVAFKTTGQTPLVEQPLRGDYHRHDFERTARRYKLPFRMPESFPFASLAAARAYYWLADRDPGAAKGLARAVYDAVFGEGRDVTKAEAVADIAARLGVDRAALLAAVDDPAVKERLKAETEAAVRRGVFGSPFVLVDGEPFWGSDRLDQVEEWLATGGW